jgi:hypothetical protein
MMKHLLHTTIALFILNTFVSQCMHNEKNDHRDDSPSTQYDSDWENDWTLPIGDVFKTFDTVPSTPSECTPTPSQTGSPCMPRDPLEKIRRHFCGNTAVNVNILEEDYSYLSPEQREQADSLLITLCRTRLEEKPLLTFLQRYKIINTPDESGDTLLFKAAQTGEYSSLSALLKRGANPLQKNEVDKQSVLELLKEEASTSCSPAMKAWMECVTAALMQRGHPHSMIF